jgi:hypothetical protein
MSFLLFLGLFYYVSIILISDTYYLMFVTYRVTIHKERIIGLYISFKGLVKVLRGGRLRFARI